MNPTGIYFLNIAIVIGLMIYSHTQDEIELQRIAVKVKKLK